VNPKCGNLRKHEAGGTLSESAFAGGAFLLLYTISKFLHTQAREFRLAGGVQKGPLKFGWKFRI
jgi:hypothetical protein